MRDATRSVRTTVVAVVAAALAASTVGCSERPSSAPGEAPATPSSQSSGSTGVPGASTERATLIILSPRSGETVTAPIPIRYEVLEVEIGEGVHLHAYVDSTDATPIEIPLRAASGTARLPSHPLLGGRRDLIFQLVRDDHTPLPGARVVLHDLIIEGERVG
jgi:hypothetical protein